MGKNFEVNSAPFTICEAVGSCETDHACIVGTQVITRDYHGMAVSVAKGGDLHTEFFIGGDSAAETN